MFEDAWWNFRGSSQRSRSIRPRSASPVSTVLLAITLDL
jgi:hypothetical protein